MSSKKVAPILEEEAAAVAQAVDRVTMWADSEPVPEPEPEPETEPKNEAKFTVISKITVATVYGPIDAAKLPEGLGEPPLYIEKKLCRIAGFITGTKSGTTQFGPWTALTGDFSAVNADTDEFFTAKTCLIPGAMGEALVDSAEELLEKDTYAKMRFSVDIFVKRNRREPTKKYDYIVRPVLAAKLSSPAMALLMLE